MDPDMVAWLQRNGCETVHIETEPGDDNSLPLSQEETFFPACLSIAALAILRICYMGLLTSKSAVAKG